MSEKHIKPQNNDKVLALKFRQLTLIKLKEKNRYYLLTGPHCQDVTQGQFFFSFSFFLWGAWARVRWSGPKIAQIQQPSVALASISILNFLFSTIKEPPARGAVSRDRLPLNIFQLAMSANKDTSELRSVRKERKKLKYVIRNLCHGGLWF